jgi:hypothetical protein
MPWVLGVSLFCLSGFACGGILPRDSIQQLCLKAEMIVDGAHLGDGKVRVDKVFFAVPQLAPVGASIDVPSIPKHTKVLAWSNDPPIATERVVLFLHRNPKGTLEPIHLHGEGSQGLFWYDEKACYGYTQIMNPGPYRLSRMSRDVSDMADMAEAVEVGLTVRKEWERVQAINDNGAKARAMAAYLLPHTAPDGYEQWALDLRAEMRQLGPAAVPALIDVLDSALPEENLNTTVLTLLDIGSMKGGAAAIRPAVPALCKRLQRPGPTSPYYILSPLTAAGDPRAIPHVRPFLQDKSDQVRGQAARALAAMNDQESFDAIAAALLRASEDPKGRTGETLQLAKALFQLDPARARPLIEESERVEGNAGLHHFIEGWSTE